MRLIDADAAEKLFKEQYCNYCNSYNGAKCRACEVRDGVDVYNDMPTIDPVKHGRWFEECCVGDEYYRCSACGMPFVLTDGTPASNEFHYCPNCGAKMDEVSGVDDDYDPCEDCTGYGDDYSIDDDGELVCNCDDCSCNPNKR